MAILRNIGIIGMLFGVMALAENLPGDGPSEYQVKAAFLLNFARFIDWPAAPATPSAPFVIGVFGADPFGQALDQIVIGKTIGKRPLQLLRTSDPAGLRSCNIVFVGSSEARHIAEIAKNLGDSSVLLVGESEGFVTRGGIINFVL